MAAQIGFDCIEWNVRRGGHVDPARVERDLPRAVEITRQAGLSVAMITTSIQDAASPHAEAILATASGLGITYYRGGEYFRYDYAGDLWRQIQDLKPRVASLAALNEKYRTVVAYHTHSGAGNIGGNIWDLWEVIRGIDPRVVGLNYDLGHATARGGTGWIDAAHVVARHIRALAIKDVVWVKGPDGRWRIDYCPLGEGMIDVARLLSLVRARWFRRSRQPALRTQQPARHGSRHVDAADHARAVRGDRSERSVVSPRASRRSRQGLTVWAAATRRVREARPRGQRPQSRVRQDSSACRSARMAGGLPESMPEAAR